MANDMNNVFMVGRLVKDCEVRSTTNGTSVARFPIAVNRRRKNGDQWVDEVSYFDAVIWGKQADSLKSYLLKGRQIALSGELRQNRWEQDGKQMSKVEIIANAIQFFSEGNGVNNKAKASTTDQKAMDEPPMDCGPEDFEDSNVPF